MRGVILYTLPFNRPQIKKSAGVRSGDLGGQRFFEIILSLKNFQFLACSSEGITLYNAPDTDSSVHVS